MRNIKFFFVIAGKEYSTVFDYLTSTYAKRMANI